MLKRLMTPLAVAAALNGMQPAAADAATIVNAVATANVNLRAGPSTAYPVVTVVPAGGSVVNHGCNASYSWCDVTFASYRGWMSAHYMQVFYQGSTVVLTPAVAAAASVAVVTFSRAYWDSYYHAYPWYGRWSYYAPPPPAYAPPPPGRVTSHSVYGGCNGESCTVNRSTTGIYGGSTAQTRTCADGTCSSTRNTTGAYGGTATRTRSCTNVGDPGCTTTRTGPAGGTRTRHVERY
ncbi:SH3 domain-containing protein [Martelella endophytica]|uniref:Membrane protein n=1 Tax=Martelella endophytica TaxID=1486262 RepID=A0A0D5LU43_MAREN|nr:SH3 domain-containing protein [Martelella endophytica]AJY47754.1 membrane protein [Martelella endophytica]